MRFLLFLLMPTTVFANEVQDVFHINRPSSHIMSARPVTDCRANIAKILCLVDAPMDPNTSPMNRPCLAGSAVYASHFETHYDRSNPLIQKMYCHLQRIWVEKQSYGTAYATIIHDANTKAIVGGAIGIRKEVLDSNPNFDRWLTWKEELNFGGSKVSTDPLLGVLQFHSNHKNGADFLAYVLNHEFGHIFDFANAINKSDDCQWVEQPDGTYKRTGTCEFAKDSFGEFSWTVMGDPPRPASRFIGRSDLCFYSCNANNYIDPKFAPDLFASLIKTDFVSTYAGTNPMDDWAETLASYLAYEESALTLNISTGGQVFDLKQHFYSPVMQRKRDYVRKFLHGTPKYPGE